MIATKKSVPTSFAKVAKVIGSFGFFIVSSFFSGASCEWVAVISGVGVGVCPDFARISSRRDGGFFSVLEVWSFWASLSIKSMKKYKQVMPH